MREELARVSQTGKSWEPGKGVWNWSRKSSRQVKQEQ